MSVARGETVKVSKDKAIELIDNKISQFYAVLSKATYENRYDEEYKLAFYGTKTLLTELFSKEEAKTFSNTVCRGFFFGGGKIDYAEELKDYKNHINSCISQLKVYKERIMDFWESEEKTQIKKSSVKPFVSMSFDEEDRDINEYVLDILKALRIDFETGERYSKDSIPVKVSSRIENSGALIIMFVRDQKIEGGFTTRSWLLKELGIAQGCKKDVIAWVERGIKDIANLNYEKEVIYFDKENLADMERATIKFLEALKEHSLV